MSIVLEESQNVGADRNSLCVLFADITNSTGLYDALGDEGGRRVVLECIDLMKQVVERFRGTVVERVGDELLATFPDAVSAGRASCELHRAIEASNPHLSARVTIRIGFHYGPLLIDEERIFGDTIHVAQRIASQTKAQQTLTSGQTKELIPATEPLVTRFVDRTHLKGKSETFELFEIIWDEGAATAKSREAGEKAARGQPMRVLILDFGEQTLEICSTRPTATIGRDPRADVVLDHSNVSRMHARIEYRKDKFVFVDQSTNGSRVIGPDGNESFVRRDECVLTSEGTIFLGPEEVPDSDSPSVRYRLSSQEPGA
jgi:adenylate cyclase